MTWEKARSFSTRKENHQGAPAVGGKGLKNQNKADAEKANERKGTPDLLSTATFSE